MASITVTASQRADNKKKSSGSSGSVSSGSSQNTTPQYDPNKDYAAAIQDAARSGASQSVIDQLNAERNAKIAGMGLNQSALTADDIAGYRATNNGKGRTEYDSAGVLGGMDNGNYGITNPTTKDWSNFNSGVDFDSKIAAAKASGASQDTINGLQQQKEYSEKVRSGQITPYGYGEGMGYGNRSTVYNFKMKDGSIVPIRSNATNYADAAKLAGLNPDDISNTYAMTYGTQSSAYSPKGYGFGVVGGPNDFTTNLYADSDINDRLYDMNNMQLQFLSGRDGMDYTNHYAGLAYQGNGMTNAYNKGTDFVGMGNIMGGYGVEGPNMDDVYANYGNTYGGSDYGYPEYNGITAQDIANQMQDVYDNYQNSMEGINSALAQSYAYQQEQRNKEADDAARALYINKRIAQRDMPQQLASQGITGGLSESALLGLNTNYENAYQQNEASRTDAVTQLDIAKNTAIANNNMQMAGVLADLQQSSIQLQQSAAQYENQFNLSVAQMRQSQSQFEQQMAYQQAQDAWNQQYQMMQLERENTQLAAQYAYQMGDYDTIANLYDIDTSYAKKMQEYELLGAQLDYEADMLSLNKAKSSGSSRSSSSEKNLTTSQYSELKKLYNSGDFDSYYDKIDDLIYGGYTKNLDESINNIATNSDIWYRANRSGGRTAVKKGSMVR